MEVLPGKATRPEHHKAYVPGVDQSTDNEPHSRPAERERECITHESKPTIMIMEWVSIK